VERNAETTFSVDKEAHERRKVGGCFRTSSRRGHLEKNLEVEVTIGRRGGDSWGRASRTRGPKMTLQFHVFKKRGYRGEEAKNRKKKGDWAPRRDKQSKEISGVGLRAGVNHSNPLKKEK